MVVCLKCYICENEQSNAKCNNEFDLLDCEAGMDTCQTIVSYSGMYDVIHVIKGWGSGLTLASAC